MSTAISAATRDTLEGRPADDFGVIVVAYTRFGGRPPQPDWQIARALAARHPVLYVDPPTFLHDAARRRDWPAFRPILREEGPSISVLRPVASPGADRPWFAGLGDRVIGQQIEWAARRVLPPGPRALICSTPTRGGFASVRVDVHVYSVNDRVPCDPSLRHPDYLRRRHVQHLQTANVVTAVSDDLVEEGRSLGADPLLLTNGVEYDHFAAPQSTPRGLDNDRVVIGFAGGITERLNFDLLTTVADAEPDWLVVLVGPVTTKVPRRTNLVTPGAVPYAALPAWMQRFNVGTIPYWINEYNLASSPMKTFEYLAAGRPVVAVPLPMLRGLEPHVQLAADPDGFLAATRRAVAAAPSADSCRERARANSWEARARALELRISLALAS